MPFFLLTLCLLGFGWGGYEAIMWFERSSLTYQPSVWYAWPWHWPGAYLANEFFTGNEFFTRWVFPSTTELPWVIRVPSLLLRAVMGLTINLLIALIPIFLLGLLARLSAWVKSDASKSAAPHR